MAAKKFTFKTSKPTGRFSWVHKPTHYIKMGGKIVGQIGHEDYRILLACIKDGDLIKDDNPNCDWMWIKLAYIPASVDEAKQFVNDRFELLNKTYKLKQLDI